MSIRILLENFLGLMKEEGELDKFLPMLITAMGHKIIFYSYKGVRQFGVDVLSVGPDHADGKDKLFMWLIKCGDIGRSEWNSGNQSIRQSIDEVEDVFITTHVLPQHRDLVKKLVVVTNGEYHSNIQQNLAQHLEKWGKNTGCENEVVGGATLASWAEQHLLDENILSMEHRTLFRRTLANVANPELCVPVGRELIQTLFARTREQQKSETSQVKVRLTALRATRTALAVIFKWAQAEGSLESARQLAEFAILESWVFIQSLLNEKKPSNIEIVTEFNAIFVHYLSVGYTYRQKISPYLLVENAMGLVSGDALVTADLVFREIGQLGLQGSMWAFLGVESEGDFAETAAVAALACATAISNTLKTHHCTRSPAFDNHALDIHVALLCLMVAGRTDEAASWVADIISRLDLISQSDANMRFWPMHADFVDALEVRHNSEYPKDEFFTVSMLLPILSLWCAALDLAQAYDVLRTRILPRLPNTTMNIWSADKSFDSIVNDHAALHESGFPQTMTKLPGTVGEFIELLRISSHEIPSIEESVWYQARAPFIPLLAARHWRLQIPKQMLVEQVLAFSGRNLDGRNKEG